ncbi:hypothetical protein [Bacillus sp. AG4(2022)]|uniref:hypothetical protein n=1 Tax=Bacillus sp. AG4(2022) TaxID=2962594 RepID=UPI0028817004|nr:hypothetical protein [Bacillus sp. AG4(2022)]MDT0160259.1 hypothetical protein [Bacillus sp. AG4(2022)]
MRNNKQDYDAIVEIVKNTINSLGLQVGQWHLGKVTEVVSLTKLKVIVDDGQFAQTVSCNPDITFAVDDQVWVIFINGNPRDKFVLSKRAVE